jgi:pyrroline-5-carboxylate reductase
VSAVSDTSESAHWRLPADGIVRVGFVGVGTIVSAIVEALMAGPHADRCEVTLSPRSTERSAALAGRFPRVRIAPSNRAVVDAADVVILGMLPQQLEAVCADLVFRPGQIVVGLPAGWPPSRLAAVVAPATDVCQLIPLPMIAQHAGPVVLFPDNDIVATLFEGCGQLVVLPREEDVPVLSCASAVMSSYFEWQRTMTEWMTRQGLEPAVATHYATALFEGLAAEGRAADVNADALVAGHETPGGLNESMRTMLVERGLFADISRHLDRLLQRVTER